MVNSIGSPMLRMPRRTLLASTSSLAIAAVLAGCQGTPPIAPLVTQVGQDAQILVAGLTPIIALAPSFGASPGEVQMIQAALNSLSTSAAALAAEITPETSNLRVVVSAVNVIVTTIRSFTTIPAATNEVLDAALALLPAFSAMLGVSSAIKPKMGPAKARLILKASK